MSRLHKSGPGAVVMGYLTSYLLSAGMSLPLLLALMPTRALWPAALLCVPFSAGFYALFSIPFKRKWLLPLGALAALGLWAAFGGGPLFTLIQLGKAASLSLRGIPDAVAPYADTARWAVCLMFSLLGAALAWDRTLPLAAFSVIAVLTLAYLVNASDSLLLWALPAAAGLLLLMAGREGRRLSLLPVALLLPLLAFGIMPKDGAMLEPLKNTAESVRQFVEDYLLFNEYRASFTLASEGYLPLEERLGGPAQPEDHSVMEVRTGRTVLLRAKTYDDYTGLAWQDALSVRRYLAASPRFQTLRENLFDLNRPLAGDGGVSPETLQVHILRDGTTTLFVPGRARTVQPQGERMVLYFNAAAELFLTRNVAPGDEYTVTYMPFTPGSPSTAALIAACAGLEDPHYAEAASQYMTIPRHIQQEIYDFAAQATAGRETPYEKALAIQRWLKSNYGYTLNTQTPPDGVDFLAWFLIGEKQGYCTYFATAMTMLCRIAGLPARYVTGYLAAPDENGVAHVTGEDAHAWTEVYLNGFGWLAFDPTPRGDNDQNDGGDGGDPPHAGSEPTPTPSPTPEPTPTPEPEPQPPEATPTPAPSERPENSDVPPTPEPEAPPPVPPEQEKKDSPFPWWLLLLLALTALLIWRCRATEPVRRAQRHPAQAAAVLFAAICALLSRRGLTRRKEETLLEFARRAEQPLAEKGAPSLLPLAEAYGAEVYGCHPADPALFRETYLTMRSAASRWDRMCLAIRRILPHRRGKETENT